MLAQLIFRISKEGKMENFVAIVRSTGGVLDKYQDFAVEADAVSHVATYGGFVVPNPGGSTDYWVVDAEAETVVNNQDQADADTLARSWAALRTERNVLLVSSDWTQASDLRRGDEVKATWVTYREILRNLPANTPDPDSPTWPTPPE
jgi:hypothetical protein